MPSAKGKKKERRYHLELSAFSVFVCALGFLALLAWFFVLGILVGQGIVPARLRTLWENKAPLSKIRNVVEGEPTSDIEALKNMKEGPKLIFHDELSRKKEETPKPTREPVAIKKDTSPGVRNQTTPSEEKGTFTVQVASLKSAADAVRMVEKLAEKGYQAQFHKVRINEKTYFRVKSGTFSNKEDALDFKKLLFQREGIQGFVTTEREDKSLDRVADRISETGNRKDAAKRGAVYTVQIAAVDTKTAAINLVNSLIERGYKAYFYDVEVNGNTFYRVRSGEFDNRQEADAFRELLGRKEKIKGFVTQIDK